MNNSTKEVDVEEIMKRLRLKLMKDADGGAANAGNGSSDRNSISGKPMDQQSPPEISAINWNGITSSVANAEAHQYVWTTEPNVEHYHGIAKRVASVVGKTFLYFAQLVTKPQQQFNTAVMQSIHQINETLGLLQNNVLALKSRTDFQQKIESVERKFEEINSRLDSISILEKHQAYIDSRIEGLPKLEHDFLEMKNKIVELSALDRRISELGGRVDTVAGFEHRIEQLKIAHDNLKGLQSHFDGSLNELRPQVARVQEHLTRLMTTIMNQEKRLGRLLEEVRSRLPLPFDQEQLEVLARELDTMDEELYLAFEDKYRGAREDIKERVRSYLPFIQKAGAGSKRQPILDVGCGRGEWLELLKDQGLTAYGLDLSRTMVEQCQALDLKAEQGDILEYLKQIKDDSLGAITGFHVIEHLSFNIWLQVFDESFRVLAHGGVMIFETPNPENVIVGTYSFYLDPTHLNPLPYDLVKFVAEAKGFKDVEIVKLHPVESANLIAENTEVSKRFNHYFYGPRDYAIVAWKG